VKHNNTMDCLEETKARSAATKSAETDGGKSELIDDPIFRMPPVPSMGRFNRDPWDHHPLMTYYGYKEKRKQDDEVIVRHGKKMKSFIADSVEKSKKVKTEGPEDIHKLESFLTQEDFVEFLRDSVRSAPVVPLQESWEKTIISVLHPV